MKVTVSLTLALAKGCSCDNQPSWNPHREQMCIKSLLVDEGRYPSFDWCPVLIVTDLEH